jgi:hypothetical protein
MLSYDMDGICDLHIHTAPDVYPRLADDVDVALSCRDAGIRAIITKCHFESTASRAYYASKAAEGIAVFGSLVLNSPAGGLDPLVVETQLRLGIKEVWMPTAYAKAHAEIHGAPGSFGFRNSGFKSMASPITVLDEDGKLLPNVREIIALISEHDVILGTGHLSREEIFPLVRAAVDAGCKKVLVTHPHFHPPDLDDSSVLELVSMGALVEFCASTVQPVPGYGRMDQVVKTMKAVGATNAIVSSDAGAPTKPMPPETLAPYLYSLTVKGISKEEIRIMSVENPARLLGLSRP